AMTLPPGGHQGELITLGLPCHAGLGRQRYIELSPRKAHPQEYVNVWSNGSERVTTAFRLWSCSCCWPYLDWYCPWVSPHTRWEQRCIPAGQIKLQSSSRKDTWPSFFPGNSALPMM